MPPGTPFQVRSSPGNSCLGTQLLTATLKRRVATLKTKMSKETMKPPRKRGTTVAARFDGQVGEGVAMADVARPLNLGPTPDPIKAFNCRRAPAQKEVKSGAQRIHLDPTHIKNQSKGKQPTNQLRRSHGTNDLSALPGKHNGPADKAHGASSIWIEGVSAKLPRRSATEPTVKLSHSPTDIARSGLRTGESSIPQPQRSTSFGRSRSFTTSLGAESRLSRNGAPTLPRPVRPKRSQSQLDTGSSTGLSKPALEKVPEIQRSKTEPALLKGSPERSLPKLHLRCQASCCKLQATSQANEPSVSAGASEPSKKTLNRPSEAEKSLPTSPLKRKPSLHPLRPGPVLKNASPTRIPSPTHRNPQNAIAARNDRVGFHVLPKMADVPKVKRQAEAELMPLPKQNKRLEKAKAVFKRPSKLGLKAKEDEVSKPGKALSAREVSKANAKAVQPMIRAPSFERTSARSSVFDVKPQDGAPSARMNEKEPTSSGVLNALPKRRTSGDSIASVRSDPGENRDRNESLRASRAKPQKVGTATPTAKPLPPQPKRTQSMKQTYQRPSVFDVQPQGPDVAQPTQPAPKLRRKGTVAKLRAFAKNFRIKEKKQGPFFITSAGSPVRNQAPPPGNFINGNARRHVTGKDDGKQRPKTPCAIPAPVPRPLPETPRQKDGCWIAGCSPEYHCREITPTNKTPKKSPVKSPTKPTAPSPAPTFADASTISTMIQNIHLNDHHRHRRGRTSPSGFTSATPSRNTSAVSSPVAVAVPTTLKTPSKRTAARLDEVIDRSIAMALKSGQKVMANGFKLEGYWREGKMG